MNRQTVTINGKTVQINNPTLYSPDAIIEDYVKKNGIKIQQVLEQAIKSGITIKGALQDLFDRAVVSEVVAIEREYELRYQVIQKLVTNEGEIDITHETVYNPNAIIQKYVHRQGTNVELEMKSIEDCEKVEMQKLIKSEPQRCLLPGTKKKAARELFTRAVRAEEHARYRAGFTQCTFALAFIKSVIDISNLVMGKSIFMESAVFILVNFIVGGLIMGFVYDVITGIAGKLGIEARYSI